MHESYQPTPGAFMHNFVIKEPRGDDEWVGGAVVVVGGGGSEIFSQLLIISSKHSGEKRMR